MPAPFPPAAPPSGPRASHSNWALRLVAVMLSALAFLGLWQGAQHTSTATTTSSQYAPPTSGGLLPPGGLVPHGSTHVS